MDTIINITHGLAIPRKDLLVRYPDTYSILPENGAVIPLVGREGKYWRRRNKCKDITYNRILNISDKDIDLNEFIKESEEE